MILVTGANGHLGSQTIDFLLQHNPSADVAGLVRSEEKGAELKKKGIELRTGDYSNYESIQKALQEIDIVLFISSSTLQNRVAHHTNVINACVDAGVKQIFYTSMLQADKELSPLTHDHARTEEALKESGVPYTIHRHTFYTEFLPLFLGNSLETGEWIFPSGGEKINLAFRTDMAEALANGLSSAGKHKNNIYEMTSSESYGLDEIAGMLSEISGKKITYTDLSVEAYKKTLQEIGLSDEQVGMGVVTATTVVNGALSHISRDLEQLLGRRPTGVKSFIEEYTNA